MALVSCESPRGRAGAEEEEEAAEIYEKSKEGEGKWTENVPVPWWIHGNM